jgi:serine/threonine protein phosphatase PrpC
MEHENVEIRFAARSDCGRVRDTNEDSLHADPPAPGKTASHGHLFIVADGMGGHAAGEIASAIAAATVANCYYAAPLDAGGDPRTPLAVAMETANHAIRLDARRNPGRAHMGTTCTAVVVRRAEFWIAHVGDSRTYLLRDGRLRLLTQDHNLAGELFREGQISAQDVPNHRGQHVLTRSLGIDERARPEVSASPEPLLPGDRLLLCSDGLVRVLDDLEIARFLADGEIAAVADRLIAEANARGAPDNVSVVLIERPR